MSSNTAIDTGTFNPQRVVADLRELASRTGGPEGSRRLCWTPEWVNARNLLREELSGLPVDVDVDEAGNLCVRAVDEQEVDAGVPEPCKPVEIGDPAVERNLIHLEVTGVQHHSGRRRDRDRHGVRD